MISDSLPKYQLQRMNRAILILGACCHEIEAGKGHEDAAGSDLRMSGGQGKAESGEMCAILWYNSNVTIKGCDTVSRGLFITFEGNDGCGKTTISELVYQELLQKGCPCILTREPGGIDIAEQIRHIILDPANIAMDARTEALLYAASRRQHLVERVIPALDQGKIVLCDRFIDSSLAYQGMGRQIGMEEIEQMNQFATEGLMPDATIFLEVSESVSRQRLAQRGALDRMDQESLDFHRRVREGYALVRERYADRMHVIDADQDIDTVLKAAMTAVMEIVDAHR